MTNIFGVGYENKGVEKYREFSDPKLKKESDKLISDLMKDSNINKKELEKKVINFLDKYKGDTKRFPEIKQKLFLKLQKELGSQRAALNSPDSTADTDTADKISKLYVLANIVKNTVLEGDKLLLDNAINDCYKRTPEEKPAPAAPPEYKAEPELPTSPPPAAPGEQGAAPASTSPTKWFDIASAHREPDTFILTSKDCNTEKSIQLQDKDGNKVVLQQNPNHVGSFGKTATKKELENAKHTFNIKIYKSDGSEPTEIKLTPSLISQLTDLLQKELLQNDPNKQGFIDDFKKAIIPAETSSAAPAGETSGSTATAEGWGAAYRKTTPSSASTEATAAMPNMPAKIGDMPITYGGNPAAIKAFDFTFPKVGSKFTIKTDCIISKCDDCKIDSQAPTIDLTEGELNVKGTSYDPENFDLLIDNNTQRIQILGSDETKDEYHATIIVYNKNETVDIVKVTTSKTKSEVSSAAPTGQAGSTNAAPATQTSTQSLANVPINYTGDTGAITGLGLEFKKDPSNENLFYIDTAFETADYKYSGNIDKNFVNNKQISISGVNNITIDGAKDRGINMYTATITLHKNDGVDETVTIKSYKDPTSIIRKTTIPSWFDTKKVKYNGITASSTAISSFPSKTRRFEDSSGNSLFITQNPDDIYGNTDEIRAQARNTFGIMFRKNNTQSDLEKTPLTPNLKKELIAMLNQLSIDNSKTQEYAAFLNDFNNAITNVDSAAKLNTNDPTANLVQGKSILESNGISLEFNGMHGTIQSRKIVFQLSNGSLVVKKNDPLGKISTAENLSENNYKDVAKNNLRESSAQEIPIAVNAQKIEVIGEFPHSVTLYVHKNNNTVDAIHFGAEGIR